MRATQTVLFKAKIALTYTCVGRIGRRVKTSIDNMISQLFGGVQKYRYVGDIKCFEAYRKLVVHIRKPQHLFKNRKHNTLSF